MNLILLGPQGSGKGTQAELLAKKFGLMHLEMGRILRSIANSDNKYAKVVKETIDNGNLVPDEYVRLIAWDHISKNYDKVSGFIFEGYPRSLAQYEQVEDIMKQFGKKIDRVILLNISEGETIRRLEARRTCEKCGEIFNLLTKPPKNPEVCDVCGGRLVQRIDDQSEAIKRRLEIYHSQTEEIIRKAREEGSLLEVDGERPIETIFEEIVSKL